MTDLPKKITVSRIPYDVVQTDNQYTYECLTTEQIIGVNKNLNVQKKRQYCFWEIANLMLTAAGLKSKECEEYYKSFGNVLYRFITENNTAWAICEEKPSEIYLNGIRYIIEIGDIDELKDEDLGGRIKYDEAKIMLLKTIKPDIFRYVLAHECTHGLLFEGAIGDLSEREEFVEALSWHVLYFLQDNATALFMKGDQENERKD